VAIGSKLKGGEVIELVSDLGGGKTSFVRGLAKGMGSPDIVHSPSFTLSNQYDAQKLSLHHFDLYRLPEPGIIRNELSEILTDPRAVVVIEWADIMNDVLPTDRITIDLQVVSDSERHLTAHYNDQFAYLFPPPN
jgi:tRNA threonylcarbamoyladenosine biosynthesis protein TsaE